MVMVHVYEAILAVVITDGKDLPVQVLIVISLIIALVTEYVSVQIYVIVPLETGRHQIALFLSAMVFPVLIL